MADVAQGTELWKGTRAAGTQVAEVSEIAGLNPLTEVLDVTNLDDTARTRIGGLLDAGTFSVTLNFEPDNATHIDIITEMVAKDFAQVWTVVFSSPATDIAWAFTGAPTSFSPTASTGESLTATAEFTGSGPINFSASTATPTRKNPLTVLSRSSAQKSRPIKRRQG